MRRWLTQVAKYCVSAVDTQYRHPEVWTCHSQSNRAPDELPGNTDSTEAGESDCPQDNLTEHGLFGDNNVAWLHWAESPTRAKPAGFQR